MEIKYSLEEIKKIRHPKVPLASFLFFDPVSTRLAWILGNFTGISPNQITCLSFLTGVFSAWCFFQGVPPYLILGVLLFGLAVVLDWTDGKVARIKKQESAVGMFLDGSLDQLFIYLNIFAISYGQFKVTNQSDFLLLGLGLIILGFTLFLFGYKREVTESFYMQKNQKTITDHLDKSGAAGQVTAADRYNFLGKIKELKDYFERKRLIPLFVVTTDAAALVLIIGPIFNIIKECLILSLFLSLLMFVIYLIVNIVHLSRLSSGSVV